MKKIKLIALFALTAATVHSQELTKNNTPINQRFGFSLAYFGDKVVNKGLQIGVEKYLSTTANYNVVGSFILGTFGIKDVYNTLSLTPRIGLRYTSKFGLTAETHFGLGYLQRFYKYDQYNVNANGQLVSEGKTTLISAMPNFALGLGYDFRRKTKLSIVYFARLAINYNYPNKHYFVEASPALETGIVWIPKFNTKDNKK